MKAGRIKVARPNKKTKAGQILSAQLLQYCSENGLQKAKVFSFPEKKKLKKSGYQRLSISHLFLSINFSGSIEANQSD